MGEVKDSFWRVMAWGVGVIFISMLLICAYEYVSGKMAVDFCSDEHNAGCCMNSTTPRPEVNILEGCSPNYNGSRWRD